MPKGSSPRYRPDVFQEKTGHELKNVVRTEPKSKNTDPQNKNPDEVAAMAKRIEEALSLLGL